MKNVISHESIEKKRNCRSLIKDVNIKLHRLEIKNKSELKSWLEKVRNLIKKVEENKPYDKGIRNEICSILDSQQREYSIYQNNYVLVSKIELLPDSLDSKNSSNSTDKILINRVDLAEENISLNVQLFNSPNHHEDIKFYIGTKQLTQMEMKSFTDPLDSVYAIIRNPVTSVEKKIQAR
jgi:hypothetical protein